VDTSTCLRRSSTYTLRRK